MVEQEITVAVPVLSLVVLIGVSSSGKSTFARDHFAPTEVLSSDFFRAMVSDDENSLEATEDAFSALHFVAARRLARGHLTVVDATNVQPSARKGLIDLAKRYHAQTVAIVLDVPEALCKERNAARADRNFGDHVIPQQHKQLRRSLKRLKAEGFRRTFVLRSAEEAARVSVVREKLWTDRREEVGPFDIIGDVHGCFAELERLLTELGYDIAGEKVQPPPGRKAVFVGDLVDRGPDVPRASGAVRSFALYGETTGEQDEFGLPVRGDWAAEYRGAALSGTGAGIGTGLGAVRRSGAAFLTGRVCVGAARERRGARPSGCCRWRARRDAIDGAGHDSRGTGSGGAGGDEPFCRRPQVAGLPAADHGPAAHQRPPRCARAPR